MVTATPPITTAQQPHATDKSSVDWSWRHIALGATLGVDAIYTAIVISGLAWTRQFMLLPPSLSHIIVTVLGVATATALVAVIEGHRSARQDEQLEILSAQLAQIRAAINRTPVPKTRARRWEEPTVPGTANGTGVYASTAMAVRQDINLDVLTDTVLRQAEALHERWLTDVRQLIENNQQMSAPTGTVSHLPRARH